MTNEQLAVHIRQLKARLDAALMELSTGLESDLPEEKLEEVVLLFGPARKCYPPAHSLETLSTDLETEIETLTRQT